MGRDRAAYMREYRARKRVGQEKVETLATLSFAYRKRIAELEDEVRHLKAELAKRPDDLIVRAGSRVVPSQNPIVERFNTQPFRGPIPKSSRK